MRQTLTAIQTKKESLLTADNNSKNEFHLIRSGYFFKNMAGVYSQLPLGLRSINKIREIIRKEMNSLNAEEVCMPSLVSKKLMEKTDRWDDEKIDIWFKSKIKDDSEVGFAWTHEEIMTDIMSHHISSYKDLPYSAYQFQTKFRNEIRAKSGIMRTREFEMKDLYTFAKDKKEHEILYERIVNSYKTIFDTVGLSDITYMTKADGGAFSKFSEEFQVVCDAGEDIIYINKDSGLAINKEIFNKETLIESNLNESDFYSTKASEVANIFTLGTRFSTPLNLKYKNELGEETPVFMGSYGIGLARLFGVIVEIFLKGNVLCLPRCVAPFAVHLILLNTENSSVKEYCEDLYSQMLKREIEVLYDDRDISAGEKFIDSDMVGIPTRLVVSKKSIEANGVEFIDRVNKTKKIISKDEVFSKLKQYE